MVVVMALLLFVARPADAEPNRPGPTWAASDSCACRILLKSARHCGPRDGPHNSRIGAIRNATTTPRGVSVARAAAAGSIRPRLTERLALSSPTAGRGT